MTSAKSPTAPLAPASQSAALPSLLSVLDQAEVCREQAREAARLKRFRSALGLFATANALYRHVALKGDEAQASLAQEQLQSLSVEAGAYGELAQGAQRGLR